MDNFAMLYSCNGQAGDVRICNDNFLIGRAKHASHDIKDVSISRTQCVIQFKNSWTLCDKSNAGTWLNGKRLKQNDILSLKDGDHIRLGESHKFNYVFCTNGDNCSNSCKSRPKNSKLDAELAQRRRAFEFSASRQKVDLEKSILQNQQDKLELEVQQNILQDNFNKQLQKLEERNQQLCWDLDKRGDSSGCNLVEEKEKLKVKFTLEKKQLQESYFRETSELATRIASFEDLEQDLKSQNKTLLERLEQERQQFEIRLEEEKKQLEVKFAEQLAEQQKLAKEKSEVEEALRQRIKDLEKVKEEQQLQRKAEQEVLLSKEKNEFEERLRELQNALQEKEHQDKEKEQAFLERERELRAQEESMNQERKKREEKLEAEFLAKRRELEELENERKKELDRHKQEVTKELQDREAELKRKAEEHQRELEAQRTKEQEQLRKELEEKKQDMQRQLEWEIMKLQEEKVAIEINIRGEQSKKEGENAKTLEKLQAELEVVKSDLDQTSNKRKLLEKELEEASNAKETASKNELEAKRIVVETFGDLMESELQCSICNELFVLATTLNCNHTFCQLCISNWLEKKKDCPICRTSTVTNSRSIVLDSFIDKMVENLSDDLKKRRKEIVEERRVLAHVAEMEGNPNKKRKTAPRQIAVTLPLQVLNHNVTSQQNNVRILVPVPSIPAGATVYRPTLVPAQSTSRDVHLLAGGPSTSHGMTPIPGQASVHQRPHVLQPQLPSLVHPSSSAPILMTTPTQVHPGGVRTRGGGATRPPNAHRVPMGVPVATRPPHGIQTAAPRTVPPLVLRTRGPSGGYTVARPTNHPTRPHR